MSARELEAALLARCAAAARDAAHAPTDQREANVYHLSALILRFKFPEECTRLLQASEKYFAAHPGEKLLPEEVVQKGWVISPARQKDMLSRLLAQQSEA
jgi:hypothetical protein